MSLYAFDEAYRTRGYSLVGGVDEAGRGPLAGPVVAAAVILPAECRLEELNDSKKLTEKKREMLYDLILEQAVAWGIGSADHLEIDAMNILQASMLAMRRAVEELCVQPDCLLVDGNRDPEVPDIHTEVIVKGDAASASIAAASVLAKVTRDRILKELDGQYPQYQFAKHKGYPTRLHYQMLDEHGPTSVHRQSFLKKWLAGKG